MESFHEWKKDKWAVRRRARARARAGRHDSARAGQILSRTGGLHARVHDRDRPPRAQHAELVAMDVGTLSVDPVKSHEEWLTDAVATARTRSRSSSPSSATWTADLDRVRHDRPGHAGRPACRRDPRGLHRQPREQAELGQLSRAAPAATWTRSAPHQGAAARTRSRSRRPPTGDNHADIPLADGTRRPSTRARPSCCRPFARGGRGHHPGYHTCDLPEEAAPPLVKADDVSPAAPADLSPVKSSTTPRRRTRSSTRDGGVRLLDIPRSSRSA